MSASKKDLLTLFDFSPDELRNIISLAAELKAKRYSFPYRTFDQRSGVLIFEKPSLRTRITFETAINELGGHAINLASNAVGMGKRESVEDVARNLERVVHLIVARTFDHETVVQLARFSSIPVINALTDSFHPCQALAFALTVHENRPDQKSNIVFVGDGNNVCNSIMVICAKLGYNFTVVGPNGYAPNKEMVKNCQDICKQTGGTLTITNDLFPAIQKADMIYTDVWASMGQEEETEKRRKVFKSYQVNSELISKASDDVLVSHCLPAHRDEEITSDVLDSSHSVAFDEAENRLHVQKAAIVHLFSQHR
ncbi:MAG: ornithine carbamoyltransferase [Chitinispirillaceae bacterium]